MSPRSGLDTLDLVLRASSAVFTASGSVDEGKDIVLTGQLSGIEQDAPISPVRLILESAEAESLRSEETGSGTVKLFSGTEELPFRLVDYSMSSVIDKRYEIHSGSVEDAEGTRQFDFVAVSEPIHIPIIGALLVVGVCPLLAGASFLSEWVQARTSGWRKACSDAGGFPFVVPVFRLKVKFWKGTAECEAKARVECRRLDGTLLSANETGFERLKR